MLFQLGGMLHLAAAPHGICWEHGVVVDLDGAPAGVGAVAAPEGLSRGALPLVRSDQHPHCPAVWVLRQARLERPSAAPVVETPQRATVSAEPDQVPPPTGWALHRAPKQSPPV